MRLKTKVATILIFLSIIYVLLDASIQYFFIYPNFLTLEKKEALSNIDRCVEALQNEIDHLDTFCHDWSAWDDTYNFVYTGSAEYVESNLPPNTFFSSSINLIHIVNQSNQMVWGKSYDLETQKEIIIKEFTPEQYKNGHLVWDYSDKKLPNSQIKKNGIIITQTGPMIFTARPILNSEHEGPSRGHIIMAKYLDKNILQHLRNQTHVAFTIHGYPQFSNLPEIVRLGLINNKHTVEIKNKSTWTLYRYLPGVVKESGLLVETHFPREITKKAIASMRFALASLCLGTAVLLIITILFIHLTVINPIVQLTQHTKDIKDNRAFLADTEIVRKDEIGVLGRNFNQMLAKIREQTDELIVANLNLGKLSGLDGLTGISNRRRFDEKLEMEWKRSWREKIPLALILCDIDFFKKYNDSLGHQAGDRCLRQVAEAIQKAIHRPSDLSARYGGEEFGIILFNTDSDGAAIVAERIRSAIEALDLNHPDSDASRVVTISLGVATMLSNGQKGTSELLAFADKALYQAKENGRNRFVIHREDIT